MTRYFQEINQQPTLTPGIYQHYKGPKYEVLGLARHSETEEWLVCYRALYGDHGYWVRPYSMFIEKVKSSDGQLIDRFSYQEDSSVR